MKMEKVGTPIAMGGIGKFEDILFHYSIIPLV